jgi:cell division protease FtsH
MEHRQRQVPIWYVVIAFILLLFLQSIFMGPHVETLAYSEFKTLLRAGKIARVTLSTEYLRGQLRTEGLDGLLPKELRRVGEP